MKVFTAVLKFRTNGPSGVYDLTEELRSVVKASKVLEGVAWVSAEGATPALILTRCSDVEGVVRFIESLIPAVPEGRPWSHGNAYAHLRSTILSTLKLIPVVNGEALLPRNYCLYFLETRPVYNHLRRVFIQVHGVASH